MQPINLSHAPQLDVKNLAIVGPKMPWLGTDVLPGVNPSLRRASSVTTVLWLPRLIENNESSGGSEDH